MIKLTAAISPRPDWTIAEWQIHYVERHAPLTASVPNFTRHGVRYLQNYVIGAPDVPDFPERDVSRSGVTELWFDSVAKIQEAYTEPDYLTYLRTDELRFASFDNILVGIASEDELFCSWNPAGSDRAYLTQPRFKVFVFRHRKADGDRARLQQAWKAERAPILIESEPFRTYVRRYVQTSMLDDDVGMPGEVPHDLIDEFSFDTLADAIAFWGAYHASEQQRAADDAHSDRSKLWMLFARQHEVFGPLPA